MSHDLDTPEGRHAYIEAFGPDAYNRAMQEKLARDVVETVNGHAIRTVQSRFGRLFAVGDTKTAYATLAAARDYANSIPPAV